MAKPPYAIGQHVAVSCLPIFMVVIPKTIVRDMEFVPRGYEHLDENGELWVVLADHWEYLVDGESGYIDECFLRPINPDTEYLTDSAPQKLETTL